MLGGFRLLGAVKLFIVTVVFAAAASAFSAENAPCEQALVGHSFGIHIDITIDPHTGRVIEIKPGPYQGVAPAPAPPPPAHRPAPNRQRTQHELNYRQAHSLGQQFHNIAADGLLIQQNDWRLAQRNLLVPNGGLCATTCAVNVMHAISRYLHGTGHEFGSIPDFKIHQMVNKAWENHRRDARTGLDLYTLSNVMRDVSSGLPMTVQHYMASANHGGTFRDFALAEDEIILAAVESGFNQNGAQTYHALVITAVDIRNGRVTYSDPNFPNQIRTAQAKMVLGQQRTPTLWIDYRSASLPTNFTGTLDAWLRIRARHGGY
jgi:hypothetical protein